MVRILLYIFILSCKSVIFSLEYFWFLRYFCDFLFQVFDFLFEFWVCILSPLKSYLVFCLKSTLFFYSFEFNFIKFIFKNLTFIFRIFNNLFKYIQFYLQVLVDILFFLLLNSNVFVSLCSTFKVTLQLINYSLLDFNFIA